MSKTNVYANGLEVACKASDGKSPAAFPDPCWSPPSPKAGWIVIPYANTAYAKDTSNASKTVFIGNKPVMLKDKSYFKKSTGNEPAASSKGLATGVKKGKAYFTSWSMDIKVEGYNVCRHTDLMTHNHGSTPGNTGAWHFLSEKTKGKCRKAIEAVEDYCDVSKKEQKRFVRKQEDRNNRRKKRLKKKGKSYTAHAVRPKTWKDNHCQNLLLYPDVDQLKDQMEKLEKEAIAMYENLTGEIWDVVKDRAIEQAKATGTRMGTKWVGALGCTVASPAATAACEAAVSVWNAVDAVYSVVAGGIRMVSGALDAKQLAQTISDVSSQLEAVKEVLGDEEKKKALREELIKKAEEAALDDDCLQARRCMLVPYEGDKYATEPHIKTVKVDGKSRTEIPKGKGDTLMTKLGMGTSGGCCPGQTGHHLIPDSWVKDANCKAEVEGKETTYTKGRAPVVCVEGVNHSDGTHGVVHGHLNTSLKKAKKDKLDAGKNSTTFAQSEVIDMAVASHKKAFPKSKDCTVCWGAYPCDEDCVRAQLEGYYRCENDLTPEEIKQGKIDEGNDAVPTR